MPRALAKLMDKPEAGVEVLTVTTDELGKVTDDTTALPSFEFAVVYWFARVGAVLWHEPGFFAQYPAAAKAEASAPFCN
jgi:hypothetical protein